MYSLAETVPSASTATHNRLFGSLPTTLRARLAPEMKRMSLTPGARLTARNEPITMLWFPETVVVAMGETLSCGTTQDVGIVGREGIVGWSLCMGEAKAPFDATVALSAGTALALPADRVTAMMASEPELIQAFLRFAHRFTMQVTRSLTSHLHDPADRRIARLLLMLHDRIEGDTLAITHRFIGNSLNLRRATVTDSLHILEGNAIVRCVRGRITMRDRNGLMAVAGTSYSAVEGLVD